MRSKQVQRKEESPVREAAYNGSECKEKSQVSVESYRLSRKTAIKTDCQYQ